MFQTLRQKNTSTGYYSSWWHIPLAFAVIFVITCGIFYWGQANMSLDMSVSPVVDQQAPVSNPATDFDAQLSADPSSILANVSDIELVSAKMPAAQPDVSGNATSNPLHAVLPWRYTSTATTKYVYRKYYRMLSWTECKRVRAIAHNPYASCRIYFTVVTHMKKIYRPRTGPSSVSGFSSAAFGVTPLGVMPENCWWVWTGQNFITVSTAVWNATAWANYYTDDKPQCMQVMFTRVSCTEGGFFWDIDIKKCDAAPALNEPFPWNQVEFGVEFKNSFLVKDLGPINFSHSAWGVIWPATGAVLNLDVH